MKSEFVKESVGSCVLVGLVVFAGAVPVGAATGSAANEAWQQFRGPRGDGVAAVSGLARAWTEEGPAEVFRREIGAGFSTVAIVGDRLYTMEADDEVERLVALDAKTGATLWSLPVGVRFASEFGDGPRATPVVVGNRVVASSADLQLVVADTDGRIVWQKNLAATFGSPQPRFGFAPSPIVVGDPARVVLEVGGLEGEGLAAFDLETGDVVWTALDGNAGSSTPIVATLGGVEQLVFHRRPEVVALDLDGQLLWRHPSALDAIVMPVALPGDRIFVSAAAMGEGGVMLRVAKTDDGFAVEEEWVQARMRNHFNTSVLVGSTLYGFDNATLRAVDASTGDLLWAHRGFGKGSVTAGDGLLFVLGDAGTLALVEATPVEYRELGRVQAMEGRSWTSPSLAGSLLVVRDHDELVAYDVGGGGEQKASEESAGRLAAGPAAVERFDPTLDLGALVARYEIARGGRDAWRDVRTLYLAGTWTTFSQPGPFEWFLHRGQPDLSRLYYRFLGTDFERGRDENGLWLRTAAFGLTEPSPVEIPGMEVQLRAEAELEPALIGWKDKGLRVEVVGPGEIDGRETVEVRLVRPGSEPIERRTEVWHLDPATGLEIAVDSTVVDPTQRPEPFPRRTFYGDFRSVAGLVIPHRISHEFGARLEEIEVETVLVDPPVDPAELARDGEWPSRRD